MSIDLEKRQYCGYLDNFYCSANTHDLAAVTPTDIWLYRNEKGSDRIERKTLKYQTVQLDSEGKVQSVEDGVCHKAERYGAWDVLMAVVLHRE